MKYFKYLSYVMRHKWYVFVACCRLGIPWRGIVHDLSKFRPREFLPYAHHFFAPENAKNRETGQQGYFKPANTGNDEFELAWLFHIHSNPHHWQYWQKLPSLDPIKMPNHFVYEMLADWWGAGRAQHKPDTVAWYIGCKDKIILESHSRFLLHWLINKNMSWLSPKGTKHQKLEL